ncbi:MAG: sigma-54 dependent transcriptional regulator [Gammaproteobacteria bacterium]
MSMAYVLVVDDERDIRELVKEILVDEGYEVAIAENGEAARRARRERRPDLVLLDIWMPDIDGISLLKEWGAEEGDALPPVIMMSGHGTVETAVEATRLGAYDFLEKPLSMAKLLLTIKRALEADRLRRENLGLRRHDQTVTEPVGHGTVMHHLREQAKRIAQHDAWVLITGEPGSGKELFARYLHANSMRRNGPFIDAGVPQGNPAIELFGSEEGGKIHYGRFEQANGGTLFLDEIGDMDAALQARLLRTLQSRSFMRVGGSEPVKLDARVLAATHHDLAQDVQTKRFREDLYYQLNVVPLRVPPLREHCEDVPELLNYYMNVFVNQDNLPYRRFSMAAQNRLRNYPWPGNVRELKNLVQRLLILGTGAEIGADEVDAALGEAPASMTATSTLGFDLPLREARDRFEKAYLEYQLRETGGNITKVAKLAGMERTHLYRKMRALGISIGDVQETADQ